MGQHCDNTPIIITNETTLMNRDRLLENKDNYPVYFVRNNSSRSSSRSNHQIGKEIRHRLVHKTGKYGLFRTNSNLRTVYLYDLVNTLISNSWYWILIVLFCGLFFSFLLFASVYMLITQTNDDYLNDDNATEICLVGIQSFTGYLLFSVETQMTIGFGTRAITHYCPEAIFVLCLQILTGTCICGVVISIFYEKISGSKKINSMASFSRFATICQRDNEYCLIFRVRDMNQRYQCNNQISAYLLLEKSGEYQMRTLKLENIGFLFWPIEIVHRINETSPLWDLSAKDLIIKSMEIIVTMQGMCLSTSNISSTTTSYISKEILWGHRFTKCVKFNRDTDSFIVDHRLFNKTETIQIPLCSAKRYREIIDEISNFFCNYNIIFDDNSCEDSGIASQSSSSIIQNTDQDGLKNDPLLVSLERFLSINTTNKRMKYEETQF